MSLDAYRFWTRVRDVTVFASQIESNALTMILLGFIRGNAKNIERLSYIQTDSCSLILDVYYLNFDFLRHLEDSSTTNRFSLKCESFN